MKVKSQFESTRYVKRIEHMGLHSPYILFNMHSHVYNIFFIKNNELHSVQAYHRPTTHYLLKKKDKSSLTLEFATTNQAFNSKLNGILE